MHHAPDGRKSPLAEALTSNGSEIACVPRRFGLATIMIVSAACAALFGVARFLGWEPLPTMLLFAFLCVVAAAQMWAGPRWARWVSTGAGCVVSAAVMLFISIRSGRFTDLDAILSCLCLGLVGALSGYVAGVMIAGVFLLIDRAEAMFARRRERVARTSE